MAHQEPGGWWRSAVVYQVYVRSFADSDGDGVGDLAGIRSRLPYLRDLGVDALWITPFYLSPMVDGGYDVADYRQVDPMFGTLDDFDAMIAEAHRDDIKIIIDLVPNHTSSAHPWFQEALRDSGKRDRYIFRDGKGEHGGKPPNDWESIFGGPAWTRVPDGQWYLHLFDPEQPDLNWENPEVRAEFEDVLRFWLDRGVDGFRVDVAHGLVKADGLPDVGYSSLTGRNQRQSRLLERVTLPYFDQDGVHEVYRAWRPILDSYPGDRMAVGEAWASTPQRLARYVGPDELHQVFNFDFLDGSWSADSFRKVVDTALIEAATVGAPTTWVLSNHDKPRHVTRYGDGGTGLRRARAAALLMLALPGVAYLYQGEELGLAEVLDIPDELRQDPAFRRTGESRDGCRVPIPWSGDRPPYAFGPTGCAESWLPAPATWASLSVAAQTGDPGSTLELYRAALALRRQHEALGLGELEWLEAEPGVLAFRRTDGTDAGLTCVVNFGSAPVDIRRYGRPLLASELFDGTALPVDTAAWLNAPSAG